jgi:1-pyrroline-5-carboxylate dehydrogenase
MLPEFKNQPFTDFSVPENRESMQAAVTQVRSELGKEYDIVIAGEHLRSPGQFHSVNPARKEEIVGIFQKGTRDLVERAVTAAEAAFQTWSRTSAQERVEYLVRVSQLMQKKRFELAAWMVTEVGKSWVEADADVAEAIDFCDYYSQLMLKLDSPEPLVPFTDEANELFYIPLGVGIIIPPWNFPLAILAGMTFAAIVAGNTGIIKPSSDSPAVGAQLMRIFEEAELPAGVVNYLSGSGSEIGDSLVLHPKTRFVAFTGSKEVGLRINELAAKPQPGQIWIKRVIAEMGGKDSIIVDDEADLDEAVVGVVSSAFGYQGQKCSACSRAIVVETVYDEFLERLQTETAAVVREGDVVDPEVNFGPVINDRAQESILRYIEIGKSEGRLLTGGKAGDPSGFNVHPTIIADVDPQATISQEEIFGPVLAVIKASSYDEALQIANNTEYGLTGSVYSKNEVKLQRARREFHVGNLYFNRKCTGALVGVHPFGGFNMSGTDSKAGGPDYLLLFTQAKAVSAKLSR